MSLCLASKEIAFLAISFNWIQTCLATSLRVASPTFAARSQLEAIMDTLLSALQVDRRV